MLARNETIFKWTLYAAVTALCFLLQSFILQRFTVLGVIPFIYPVVVAVLAMLEGPFPGTVFAIVVGVVCDVLLPGAFPCLYTVIFPLAYVEHNLRHYTGALTDIRPPKTEFYF